MQVQSRSCTRVVVLKELVVKLQFLGGAGVGVSELQFQVELLLQLQLVFQWWVVELQEFEARLVRS